MIEEPGEACDDVDELFGAHDSFQRANEIIRDSQNVQDITAAIALFEKAASMGHMWADWELGKIYLSERYQHVDAQAARAHFRRFLARWKLLYRNSFQSNAASNVAMVYMVGVPGVSKDYDAAAHWLEIAARTSGEDAYQLGKLHKNRMINRASEKAAYSLFRRAALSGHRDAQFEFGMLLQEGIGADRNEEMARTWFRRAFNQGNKNAGEKLRKL